MAMTAEIHCEYSYLATFVDIPFSKSSFDSSLKLPGEAFTGRFSPPASHARLDSRIR